MPEKRHILLCVAGGTPQIITETLWALMQPPHNLRVDEVRVITTLEGQEKILTGKINGRGSADESLLEKKHGQFFQFLKDYPAAGKIKFDQNCLYILTTHKTGIPSPRDNDRDRLSDILNDEDNAKAANQICEIVRELASDETVCIHASIAGGRKTMGLYLAAAMQLFGRNEDTMSHVLVSKEIEFGAPKFFYPTPQPEPIVDSAGKGRIKPDGTALTTQDVGVHLANIPFIRLRGIGAKLLNKPVTNYANFVAETQNELQFLESASELRLSPRKGTVRVFNRQAVLSPRQMFVYAMFAYFRKNNIGERGYVGLDEITEKDLEKICALFVSPEKGESAIDAFRVMQRRAGFIDSFISGEVRAKLMDEKRRNYRKHNLSSARDAAVTPAEASAEVLQSYRETLDRITERLVTAQIDSKFDISRKGAKGGYIFGLDIQPERIEFE